MWIMAKKSKKVFRWFPVIGVLLLLAGVVLAFIRPPIFEHAHAGAKIGLNYRVVYMTPGQKVALKLENTGETPSFSSSEKSVASAGKTGTVAAKKNGKAVITAKLNGKTYQCRVKVIRKSKYNERARNSYLRTLAKQKMTWACGKVATKNLKYKFADLGSNGFTDVIVYNTKTKGKKKYRIYSYEFGYLTKRGDFAEVGTNNKEYFVVTADGMTKKIKANKNNRVSFVDASSVTLKAPSMAANDLKRTIRRKPAESRVLAADIDKGDLKAYFKSYKIRKGDDVCGRIWNKSYKPGGRVALSSLRYIKVLHYDYKGRIRVGELIVSKKIAGRTTRIFKKLYQHQYQIKSMYLIDKYYKGKSSNENALKADDRSLAAGNTAAFNYRTITGRSTLSYHGRGLAIDLNTFENPCLWGSTCYPPKARKYLSNRSRYKHTIGPSDYAYRLFTGEGFFWGGNWSNPVDYQHFEYQK